MHNATDDGFTYVSDIGGALPSGQNTYTVALGDVNGDGKLDAVQSGWGPHGVFLGDGAGHFSQDPAHPTYDSATYLTTNSNMVLADMNNDGVRDVVQSLRQSLLQCDSGRRYSGSVQSCDPGHRIPCGPSTGEPYTWCSDGELR